MPNSPGAPVLDDTRSLWGVHIKTSYYLNEVHAQNQVSKKFVDDEEEEEEEDVWS